MSEQPVSEKPVDQDGSAKKVRRLFSVLAIVIVVIGQTLLFTAPIRENIVLQSPNDPAFLQINTAILILILGVLLFIWSQEYEPPKFLKTLLGRFQFSLPTVWITASLLLSLLAVMTMLAFEEAGRINEPNRANFIPVVTLWYFAGMCYLVAFAKDKIPALRLGEWLKLHRYELVGVGLLTLLAIALRFYKLGEIPRVINGDEGRIGLKALATNQFPFVNPFSLWENFGGLYLQGINIFLTFFGPTPFSVRLIAAIGGTLAIPAIYLLARQISGPRVAMLAAAFMAISHTQINFSRTVAVAYIQGTWLIPLELYFLLSGITKRSSWRAALGGILLAIHFSIYLDAQMTAGLILVYMLIALVFLRPWFKPALRQAAVFWGGFAIMILPEFVYAMQHPADFFNRVNRDGTFQSGWLAQEVVITNQNEFVILGERFAHAFLSLIYIPAFDFYGSPYPMLSLISAALFLIGLGIVLWKTHLPGFLLLNGYFWIGPLAIGALSIPASADSYRMLVVLPAAWIMAAISLDYILELLGVGWAQARTTYVSITGVILVFLLIFNLWAYYIDFAGRCLYGTEDGPTRFASYLGNYVRTIDRESQTFLLSDDVYKYGTHLSVDFLSANHPIINVPLPVDTLQVKPDETIIAVPDRIPELRTWADAHPGGKLHYEYDCKQTILLAYQFP